MVGIRGDDLSPISLNARMVKIIKDVKIAGWVYKNYYADINQLQELQEFQYVYIDIENLVQEVYIRQQKSDTRV